MSLISKSGLSKKLQSKKYRDAFVSARISQTLALQARVLRQKAKMSQQSLADALGTSQNAVFRVENPKYGKHSLATLRKWASFFDVGLVVRFAPYSEIVDWSQNLSQSSMEVLDFAHDPGLSTTATPIAAAAQFQSVEEREDAIIAGLPIAAESVYLDANVLNKAHAFFGNIAFNGFLQNEPQGILISQDLETLSKKSVWLTRRPSEEQPGSKLLQSYHIPEGAVGTFEIIEEERKYADAA